jgi:hypothetical protein
LKAADLTKLSGLLSKSEMAEAQRRLNVELADSMPLAGEFVDTMTDGLLSGFNGTLSSMGDRRGGAAGADLFRDGVSDHQGC